MTSTRLLVITGMVLLITLVLASGCGWFGYGSSVAASGSKQQLEKAATDFTNITTPPAGNTTPPVTYRGLNLMMYGGVAIVALGFGMLILKRFSDAVLSIAGGFGLIVTTMFIEQCPWMTYLLGGGVILFMGYVLLISYRGRLNQIAMSHIVKGVDTAPIEANKAVRDQIEKVAGNQDKIVRKAVNQTKKKLSLVTTNPWATMITPEPPADVDKPLRVTT